MAPRGTSWLCTRWKKDFSVFSVNGSSPRIAQKGALTHNLCYVLRMNMVTLCNLRLGAKQHSGAVVFSVTVAC